MNDQAQYVIVTKAKVRHGELERIAELFEIANPIFSDMAYNKTNQRDSLKARSHW